MRILTLLMSIFLLSSTLIVILSEGPPVLGQGSGTGYNNAVPSVSNSTAYNNAVPSLEKTFSELGLALNRLGNYREAIIYLDRALTIDPKDIAALNNKGWALSGLGNYTQAIPFFDKALAIDPNYQDALMGKQNALSNLPSIATAPSNVTASTK